MAKIKKDENVETPKEEKTDLNLVLERLDRLEKENKELKEKGLHPMKKARERYEGDRSYSYKMWGGIPVLDYESFKKDKTKDFVYKAPSGNFVYNHYLKLTLANGKTTDVEVNEFNTAFERSEKIIPKSIVQMQGGKKAYVFETEKFGEFEVMESVIN